MLNMKIIVEGKTKGKARPRIGKFGGYTPKDTVTYENWVKVCYQNAGGQLLKGPVRAKIDVYYKVPKSYTKKRLQAIRDGLDYPCKGPDSDNVAKIILDSLNKIAFDDDSQVVELIVNKLWTEDSERVEFELLEIL